MKSKSQDVAGAFAIARGNVSVDVNGAGGAFAIARGNEPVTIKYAMSDDAWSVTTEIATAAVNENQSANFCRKVSMRSGLNIMQGERRGIQVNQHNTNQARVPQQDPLIKAMNQRINDVQSLLKQFAKNAQYLKGLRHGNKDRQADDRNGKDKKFFPLDRQNGRGKPSAAKASARMSEKKSSDRGKSPDEDSGVREHYAYGATSCSAMAVGTLTMPADDDSAVPVFYLRVYGKRPSRAVVVSEDVHEYADIYADMHEPKDDSDDEDPANRMPLRKGHGGVDHDQDEPVMISVNGGAPKQLTYPKCTIAHLNGCIQRLYNPTKPGPTVQPESVASGPTTMSSLASAMEDSCSELEPTTGHKPRRSTRMSKPPSPGPGGQSSEFNGKFRENATLEFFLGFFYTFILRRLA